jgi:hypothetical protein
MKSYVAGKSNTLKITDAEATQHTETLMEYFQKIGRGNVLEPLLVNFKESENSNSSSKDKDDTQQISRYFYYVENIYNCLPSRQLPS